MAFAAPNSLREHERSPDFAPHDRGLVAVAKGPATLAGLRVFVRSAAKTERSTTGDEPLRILHLEARRHAHVVVVHDAWFDQDEVHRERENGQDEGPHVRRDLTNEQRAVMLRWL